MGDDDAGDGRVASHRVMDGVDQPQPVHRRDGGADGGAETYRDNVEGIGDLGKQGHHLVDLEALPEVGVLEEIEGMAADGRNGAAGSDNGDSWFFFRHFPANRMKERPRHPCHKPSGLSKCPAAEEYPEDGRQLRTRRETWASWPGENT